MLPDLVSLLMKINDDSVEPSRSSVFTGETKDEEGITWYQFIDAEGSMWAGVQNGTLIIDEDVTEE